MQARAVRSRGKGAGACAGQMRDKDRQYSKQASALHKEARCVLTAKQRWPRGWALLRRTGRVSTATGRVAGRLTMSRRTVSRALGARDSRRYDAKAEMRKTRIVSYIVSYRVVSYRIVSKYALGAGLHRHTTTLEGAESRGWLAYP